MTVIIGQMEGAVPAFTAVSGNGVPLLYMEAESSGGIATNVTPGLGWAGKDEDARILIGRLPEHATCLAIADRMGDDVYLVAGKSTGEEAAPASGLRDASRATARAAYAAAVRACGLTAVATARWR